MTGNRKPGVVRLVLMLLGVGLCVLPSAAEQAVIDVLTVYERNALELLAHPEVNRTPEQVSEIAISQLNSVLQNSGIADKVRFNCCGVFKAPSYTTKTGANGAGIDKDLEAIEQYAIAGLEEARNSTKADLVVMFSAFDVRQGPICVGVARPRVLGSLYRKSDGSMGDGFASTFHVGTIFADTTFAHEVCHLLGAGHSSWQMEQCGPQSELDASGVFGDNCCTLMCYADSTDTEANQPDIRRRGANLRVLSTPDVRAPQGGSPLGHKLLANNAHVVMRHASAVSTYRRSGREKCVNDHFADAIELPALVPYKDKNLVFCRSLFYFLLSENPQLVCQEYNVSPEELWRNREALIGRFSQDANLHFFAPEFALNQENAASCISCVYGTCTGATKQGGEPIGRKGRGNTVWYKVTAPATGVLQVGVRKEYATSGFTPVIGMFMGNQVAALTALPLSEVRDAYSGHFLRNVSTPVNAGDEVYVSVDSTKTTDNRFVLVAKFTEGGSGRTSTAPGPASEPTSGPASEPTSDSAGDSSSHSSSGGVDAVWGGADVLLLVLSIGFCVSSLVLGYFLYATRNKEKPVKQKHAPTDPWNPVKLRREHSCMVLKGILSDNRRAEYVAKLSDIRDKGSFFVGRSASSDLAIDDDTLSRCHAVFELRNDGKGLVLMVGDSGSKNGSYLNGKALGQKTREKVHVGDKLQLGQCIFKIILEKRSV